MKGQSGSYPSAWQEKNHHVLKVSFYCTNQKSQREAKSQGPGIFPWPLRCTNDQSWLWEAHQGHYVHSPRLDTLQNVRRVRVCAHSGSLHPGQEPKASTWTMKSQYDRIMKLAKKREVMIDQTAFRIPGMPRYGCVKRERWPKDPRLFENK